MFQLDMRYEQNKLIGTLGGKIYPSTKYLGSCISSVFNVFLWFLNIDLNSSMNTHERV